MDVAVKFPHFYANESVREDMLREISFMKALGKHDNLLGKFSICMPLTNTYFK